MSGKRKSPFEFPVVESDRELINSVAKNPVIRGENVTWKGAQNHHLLYEGGGFGRLLRIMVKSKMI
jgi:hypothetical protein